MPCVIEGIRPYALYHQIRCPISAASASTTQPRAETREVGLRWVSGRGVVGTDPGSKRDQLAALSLARDEEESVGSVGSRCSAGRGARIEGARNGFQFLLLHGRWAGSDWRGRAPRTPIHHARGIIARADRCVAVP